MREQPNAGQRHHSTSRARLCPGHHARAPRHRRPLPRPRPPHTRPQAPRPPRAPRFLSLSLPRSSSQLYPSAHNVLILDADSLALVRVLAFWEALPSSKHIRGSISALAVDPGLKLVVAAINSRIVAWSLSGIQQDTWRVHSTLLLPQNQSITTLDIKSGLLAVGTQNSLSVYTSVLENDLPTWSNKWSTKSPAPSLVSFAPSLMYIATASQNSNLVSIYSTTSGHQTQIITHPRPIINLSWRHSQPSSRDDLILYTITSDSALRIFLPVLDSPRTVQLHACLDLFSSLPFSFASKCPDTSSVFWLDQAQIYTVCEHLLKIHTHTDDPQTRLIKDIVNEKWDLFIRVLTDGSVLLIAVANIDRRPPTLLQQFTLQYAPPGTLPSDSALEYLHIVPSADPTKLALVAFPPLRTYDLSPIKFFNAPELSGPRRSGSHASLDTIQRPSMSSGLELVEKGTSPPKNGEREILRFVRTSDGNAVGVIRAGGVGEVWKLGEAREEKGALVHAGDFEHAEFLVVLDRGNSFATYSSKSLILTLYSHLHPPSTLSVPKLELLFTYPTPTNTTFCIHGDHCSFTKESIFGITPDFEILHVIIEADTGKMVLHSRDRLPPLSKLPSATCKEASSEVSSSDSERWQDHDVLLSVAENGELAFWVPEAYASSSRGMNGSGGGTGWRCTGRVRTERTGFNRARCSSAKKTALVVPSPEGAELTIWDSQESEFASGLEYRGTFDQAILDLDWNSTPDMQSILAVGFSSHVELLCQQRMTYFDEGPGWALCHRIDISALTPYSISDSIWLSHGSFLVGSGQEMSMYGELSLLRRRRPKLARALKISEEDESLFEYVARRNGPLEDYHPQMILQCLLWGKIELVKEIVVNLAKAVGVYQELGPSAWQPLPVERFLELDSSIMIAPKTQYKMLFSSNFGQMNGWEEGFSRSLVEKLLAALETRPLPYLTPNEHAHLLVLIQATLQIDEQRRSLDANGLRYLISMRSFYILNKRATTPVNPARGEVLPRRTGYRERLRYRDMIWAFHSESQELLVGACTTACNGKMTWADARALGLPIWLNSIESLKAQMEGIARNEYMAGENRDPVECSLIYFALGKSKLVHGLWRQAVWHKEQGVMLKFLSHDFRDPRWKTAALKNAYALMSKRRFEYAAAFFLLGGALKDAVYVCIRQLGDFQLAIALARVVEQSSEGPVLQGILKDTVLPIAFQTGNRWLGSWAFWLLHRRDLAVRILLTPLPDVAAAYNIVVEEIGEPHYDDPSLALLFSQLRAKTLQAVQGSSEISGRLEFNFILQIARVFCRMGCHVLALDLVRSWSFERPSLRPLQRQDSPVTSKVSLPPPSPTLSRMLDHSRRRRSSIIIDLDLSSLRSSAPEGIPISSDIDGDTTAGKTKEEKTKPSSEEKVARKAGLGSLMKSAKKDVQVPEFDMNAFF
ncbi:hypothetical protein AGABI2DRAFT_198048 [Agaricus bisporus var. bisporus H97]|uniref:hypothetical protein n=1 Tax=Agaricus bisporus var. bisporus (strain H97 / ATCC MYA-4626 / FGSC 10389) TaxID=936046 RepID=UPI00029F7368|nr:hypothetical protein AGABI2DRAFT_198048 [Agaricus bisporus var. bisporus H97]EKV51674.1 hypothetical protein AGABI2DRAFT_198048 [Agaricus bisporus var. bisporus H97]